MPALGLALLLTVSAHAEDYHFDGVEDADYYKSSSYEEVYGSQYNYSGPNVEDFNIPELEYGLFSGTQTGVMERARLPGLQEQVGGADNGGYGFVESVATDAPYLQQTAKCEEGNGGSFTIVTQKKAFTELTEDFKLSNGAIGKLSIPAIGVKNYFVWEGETSGSMSKGLGHFTHSSVWDGNVMMCGHNRGAKYVIGNIKDLSIGDTITYTTSAGTRTYEVKIVAAIRNDDWSYLVDTTDNRITLVTCVAGDSTQRWCVQAVMK